MDSISFVFADRAKVPGYIGIDVQDEVIGHILEMKPDKILLVCDSEADKHHPDYFKPLFVELSGETGSSEASPEVEKFMLPAGDEAKSWDNLSGLMRWAFDVGATKGSVVVAFGGGALINVAGLFASILYRGSKLVYIPTTFLAMHDVVTSLKTSICYDGRKNNIGSFYAPLKTLIDLGFCRTLPRKELFSGLGEMAKNALLLGGKHADGFVAALSKEQVDGAHGSSGDEFMMDDQTLLTLTKLGIDAKMKILANDAYEKNAGMIFEYGHTVSHAIEKAYGDGVIPHGLGVTYGMLSSSYAAERLGIMSPEDRKQHDALCWLLLKRWPLPEPRPSVERVMKFAMRDSKRGNTSEADDEISDVLLNRIGEPVPTPTHNLSKFPAKYVSKWLYSMGFPHEDDGQMCKKHGSNMVTIEETCKDILDTIRSSSESDLVGLGFEPLTVGFANHVWGVKKNAYQALVAKRYTDLAFLRLDAEAIGSVDVHCGIHGLGPVVHYSSPQGLVMERIEGRTLTETDMHKGDKALLEKVAAVLAKLHLLDSPPAFDGEPMLWRMMDRMLDAASRKPELWAPGVPGMDVISQEVRACRSAVEKLNLRVVLCHGDFKPSNVVQSKFVDDIKFIDHELAGPNYRAFDLMKIFRTNDKVSDSCMRHFLRAYMVSIGPDPSEKDVDALMMETKLFECLTWLEALCFFLALPKFRSTGASRWNALALDRWEKYESTKHMLLGKVA